MKNQSSSKSKSFHSKPSPLRETTLLNPLSLTSSRRSDYQSIHHTSLPSQNFYREPRSLLKQPIDINIQQHTASIIDFSTSTRLQSSQSFEFNSFTTKLNNSLHNSNSTSTLLSPSPKFSTHTLVSFSPRAQQHFKSSSYKFKSINSQMKPQTTSSIYLRHPLSRSIRNISHYSHYLTPKCSTSSLQFNPSSIPNTPLQSQLQAVSTQDDLSPLIADNTSISTKNVKPNHHRSASHPDAKSLDLTQISTQDDLNNLLSSLPSPDSPFDDDQVSKHPHGFKKHIPTQRKKVIIITGGTAVGKTSLSIELARKLNGEIISADSMQVYCHFDTGTAKIGLDETDGIPHHLVDIVPSGGTDFSASMFYQAATEIINNVISRRKTPILVGGTGLYLRWLLYGRPQGMNVSPDQNSRAVCINFYMSYLTKGLTGWEKSAGAGKGVGKAQQTTHSENKYKFQQTPDIQAPIDIIASKYVELNTVLDKYPSVYYKEQYSSYDIVNELINDELQHICVSNQIRWTKLPYATIHKTLIDYDSIDKNGSVIDQEHESNKTIFVQVKGLRLGLTNFHAYFPEFQTIPFLDTIYALYSTYYTQLHELGEEASLSEDMKLITNLFLQPQNINLNTTNTTNGDNIASKTFDPNNDIGYAFYQNGFPFPTSLEQTKSHLHNADHLATFYRIYTTVLTSLYSNNCQQILRNLFIDVDVDSQSTNIGDIGDIDHNIAPIKHPYSSFIPVIEHNGEYFTPRLFTYEQQQRHTISSIKDPTINNDIDHVLESLFDTFSNQISREVIKEYVFTLRSILTQQYQLHNSYRSTLDSFRTRFIQSESSKGLLSQIQCQHDIINDQEEQTRHDDDASITNPQSKLSKSNNQSEEQQHEQQEQEHGQQEQQNTKHQQQPIQSRSELMKKCQDNFLTEHMSNIYQQSQTHPFELTLTSISSQRDKFLNETPEFVQLIDQCLEDPFDLLQKYSHIVDYTQISTSTAATRCTVDGLLNTCFPGYDDPHTLPPVTYSALIPPTPSQPSLSSPTSLDEDFAEKEQQYQQSVQKLSVFTKNNITMLRNCLEQIHTGVARKIPHRLLASLTANTVYTVVPSQMNNIFQHEQLDFIPHEQNQNQLTREDKNINNSSLQPGLYKCTNDIYIHITINKPTPSLKTPLTLIHPLNALLFQNRLLTSKFKLPTIAWVEQYLSANDLYRLEKSLCHALATDGIAVPPKYKDQMSVEPLQRLSGRIPETTYDENDFNFDSNSNELITYQDQHKKHKSLYNSESAFTEGLINHYDVRCYFLHTQRNLHYRLADYRCEQMVRGGMLKETLLLLNTYNQSPSIVPFPITNQANGLNHSEDNISSGLITIGPNGEPRGTVNNEVRGLWPTSPNFDYFMRSDVDGYLKRYFPHPLHDEPILLDTDMTTSSQIEKNKLDEEKAKEAIITAPSKTAQILTSEWLYLDELMFTYRKSALPVFAQLFDITFALFSTHLKQNQNIINNRTIIAPIYHNQYKHQLLDINNATLNSSDVYTSNALTTLTFSYYERSLTYLGYLLQYPDKINTIFAHCKFSDADLQIITSTINSSTLSNIKSQLDTILGTNQFFSFSLTTQASLTSRTKASIHDIDPRLFIISVALCCFQMERTMVTYSPEISSPSSSSSSSSSPSSSKMHQLDELYTYDILSTTMDAIFGPKWQHNDTFGKLTALFATIGISLDYSTRSQLLEYDWSISDQYRSENQKRTSELLQKQEQHGQCVQHEKLEIPSLSTKQHLFNYQIHNDNTSTLYKFTTGRSGKGFQNDILTKDALHERLTDTIIEKTPKTSFTLFPCEHLIHLPEIRLIQHALPDQAYHKAVQIESNMAIAKNSTSSILPTQVLTKPVNINPMANTVISLFSPRVKSIGHTNILGFFTDSNISQVFTRWNEMMNRKEVERDEQFFLQLLSEYNKNKEITQAPQRTHEPELFSAIATTSTGLNPESSINNLNDASSISILSREESPIPGKKPKQPTVSSLTADDSSNSASVDDKPYDIWKPKVWMSTSKDKSHHFLPTIGLTADIATIKPNEHLSNVNQQSTQQDKVKKSGNTQKKGVANQAKTQSEQASSRLPWNTNTELQSQLLLTNYPINTAFVDGVDQLQTNNVSQSNLAKEKEDKGEASQIQNLRQIAKTHPNKPPVQVSIADLREIIPPTFVSSFISLMTDFQISTRGYIKRQHTFFQDEPVCQMVTIPYENIPFFMHNIDHSSYKSYHEIAETFLKQIGASYDSILHSQYDNAKEKHRLKVLLEKQQQKQQQQQPQKQQLDTNFQDTDSFSSSSSTSSSSSSIHSCGSTISNVSQLDTTSYSFPFPKLINFALLPKEQFAVKDVKFTNVHLGSYYKELMHQYIPQHVKNSINDTLFLHNGQLSPISSSNNTVDEMIGLHSQFQPIENNSKHPFRRAMPVLYDFSDTKYSLLTRPRILPQDLSPQYSHQIQEDPYITDPIKNSRSSLGIYKTNLQHVINEICDDILTKPQHEYWEYMLLRHEHKKNAQPPVKTYPYTTLSPIPPLLEACTDLTAFQSQLQLFWNDGIILETVIDLCEFQRGLSRIISHHHSNSSSSSGQKNIQSENIIPDSPLDVQMLNYFTKHKTILKQDLMSTRAIDPKTGQFLSTSTSDMVGSYSLSSPINNTTAASTIDLIVDKSSASNVQSVRQHGVTSSNMTNNGLGKRIPYPWQHYRQVDNNELLNTKHSY